MKNLTLSEAGRMDGRFDGQAGVFDPELPDRDYREAYGMAHAVATAQRERVNARLTAEYEAAKRSGAYDRAVRGGGAPAAELYPPEVVSDDDPAQERVRLFRQRILNGMSVEQAKAADVADEKGRWGSGVYGCGYGDAWSQTLEEVFQEVLGDGWWEQVCAEAEARQDKRAGTTQCGPKRSPRYDSDGNEYVEHTLYDGLWQRVTAYGAVGAYKLNEEFDLVEMAAWELEAIESLRNRETGPGAYRRNLPSMAPAAPPAGGPGDTSATGPKPN